MSGTGDWRSRRWDATHAQIYDVALRLFQEQGFEQVSVTQIAAAAGVSVPTFYAHYPSKEHLIMRLPTAHEFAALLAGQPGELPLADRIRRAVTEWLAQWTPEIRADVLARWRIVATTPPLRTRAAQFERATAGVVADALPVGKAGGIGPTEAVVLHAYTSAYTAALLAWADSDGERSLEECMAEAFDALRGG